MAILRAGSTIGGKVIATKNDIDNLTKANIGLGNVVDKALGSVDNVKQMPIAGGTFEGVAKAQANTAYTTAQLRDIILSTADASGVASNGAVWIKYKA